MCKKDYVMGKVYLWTMRDPEDPDIDPNNMGFDGPEGVDDDGSESEA